MICSEKEGVENGGASETCSVHDDNVNNEKQSELMEREIEVLDKAWRAGVVHLVGENEVIAGKEAGTGKRILINYAYNFLRKNLRQTDKMFDIPRQRLLKVGMTYEL